ncbi:Scr1 family TA system antitoxin-like transcriptional regulator [Actinoplanes sp. NPDC051494]|uniref:Scr1 family TA system antitoxin-like transcriptional regulator n=1 Tax=Actinoplanes sp. NPDC051494 TaxID=3363907 RepID=UPI0037B0DE66
MNQRPWTSASSRNWRQVRHGLAEASLANRVCPPEVMPAQIRRIREVARQGNVQLGIVPFEELYLDLSRPRQRSAPAQEGGGGQARSEAEEA